MDDVGNDTANHSTSSNVDDKVVAEPQNTGTVELIESGDGSTAATTPVEPIEITPISDNAPATDVTSEKVEENTQAKSEEIKYDETEHETDTVKSDVVKEVEDKHEVEIVEPEPKVVTKPDDDIVFDDMSMSSQDVLDDDEIIKAREDLFKVGRDFYCFQCHKDRVQISCTTCPRGYHWKCLATGPSAIKKSEVNVSKWECPECIGTLEGEEDRKHSATLSRVSEDEFSRLIRFALGTIKQTAEPSFHYPVADSAFPDYKEFIIHPMDFQSMASKIRKHGYKSTAGFLADVKWIVHNCYIYNDTNHPLTKNATYFWRVAKNEMAEIEVCPDCFRNFYDYPKSWFVELCTKPHSLAYARLKGHPFWPCKVVRVSKNKDNDEVWEADCRFFGAHDRAWVALDSVYHLSEEYAWTKPKAHKAKLDQALAELKVHVNKIKAKHPNLAIYAKPKTLFDRRRSHLTDPISSSASPNTLSSSKEPVASRSRSSLAPQSTSIKPLEEPPAAGVKRGPGRPPSPEKLARLQKEAESGVKRGPGRPPSSSSKSSTISSAKHSSGRPSRSAAVQEPPSPEETGDSTGDSSEEGALVIDTPVEVSKGRRGSRSSSAMSSSTSGRGTKPAPNVSQSSGRPGRRSAPSEVSKASEEVPAKRGRHSQVDMSGPSSQSSSRRASTETPSDLIVDEPSNDSSQEPPKGRGRPSKVATSSAVAPGETNNVDAVDTSAPPVETKEDRQTKEEIEQLKREVQQLNKQLEADREAHAKEMKQIREAITREMSLRKSIENKPNSVNAVNNLDNAEVSTTGGKRLSDDFKKVIEDTKKQQWCAFCLNKAIYFCCWNTSYCGYDCQSKHWPTHMNVCQQHSRQSSSANNGGGSSSQSSSASGPSSPVAGSATSALSGSHRSSQGTTAGPAAAATVNNNGSSAGGVPRSNVNNHHHHNAGGRHVPPSSVTGSAPTPGSNDRRGTMMPNVSSIPGAGTAVIGKAESTDLA